MTTENKKEEVKSIKQLEKEIKELDKKFMELATSGDRIGAVKISSAIDAMRKQIDGLVYEQGKVERDKWSGMAQDQIYSQIATKLPELIAKYVTPANLICSGVNLDDAEKRFISARVDMTELDKALMDVARSAMNDLILQRPDSVKSFQYDTNGMVVNTQKAQKTKGTGTKPTGTKGWSKGDGEKMSLADVFELVATEAEKADYKAIPLKEKDGKMVVNQNATYSFKEKVAKAAGYVQG